MSFNWDAVDQREKQKKLADQEHLQILREQHEEYKIRKKNEKAKEVDMVQQMLGLIPTREEEVILSQLLNFDFQFSFDFTIKLTIRVIIIVYLN